VARSRSSLSRAARVEHSSERPAQRRPGRPTERRCDGAADRTRSARRVIRPGTQRVAPLIIRTFERGICPLH